MVTEKKYAIYGCGGFGREVLPIARDTLRRYYANAHPDSLIFISDSPHDLTSKINGVSVVSFDELCTSYREYEVVIAIGDGTARRKIAERSTRQGLKLTSLHAQTTRILDDVIIHNGAILCDFVTLTSNIRIGVQFHANIYSYVAHDCIIGDFVTLAPRVCINGNTHINDEVYIGTGAILKQGTMEHPLTIGQGALIGMGSVITKNVPPGAIVVGNPARILKPRAGYESLYEDWLTTKGVI